MTGTVKTTKYICRPDANRASGRDWVGDRETGRNILMIMYTSKPEHLKDWNSGSECESNALCGDKLSVRLPMHEPL